MFNLIDLTHRLSALRKWVQKGIVFAWIGLITPYSYAGVGSTGFSDYEIASCKVHLLKSQPVDTTSSHEKPVQTLDYEIHLNNYLFDPLLEDFPIEQLDRNYFHQRVKRLNDSIIETTSPENSSIRIIYEDIHVELKSFQKANDQNPRIGIQVVNALNSSTLYENSVSEEEAILEFNLALTQTLRLSVRCTPKTDREIEPEAPCNTNPTGPPPLEATQLIRDISELSQAGTKELAEDLTPATAIETDQSRLQHLLKLFQEKKLSEALEYSYEKYKSQKTSKKSKYVTKSLVNKKDLILEVAHLEQLANPDGAAKTKAQIQNHKNFLKKFLKQLKSSGPEFFDLRNAREAVEKARIQKLTWFFEALSKLILANYKRVLGDLKNEFEMMGKTDFKAFFQTGLVEKPRITETPKKRKISELDPKPLIWTPLQVIPAKPRAITPVPLIPQHIQTLLSLYKAWNFPDLLKLSHPWTTLESINTLAASQMKAETGFDGPPEALLKQFVDNPQFFFTMNQDATFGPLFITYWLRALEAQISEKYRLPADLFQLKLFDFGAYFRTMQLHYLLNNTDSNVETSPMNLDDSWLNIDEFLFETDSSEPPTKKPHLGSELSEDPFI